MTKHALVIQHDDTIHLGNLEPELVAAGYQLTIVDARTADFSTINPDAADLVVVLGNDSGVYEKDRLQYIAREESWLRERLTGEHPTLGVCFGAQIMASALGGEVFKGPTTQIGYRRVELTDAGASSPIAAFDGVPVLEWHGDTFTLPAGAVRLAGSEDYENEAFSVGSWALAMQFHPETTTPMYERWLSDSRETVSDFGIDEGGLLTEDAEHNARMQSASALMLRSWLSQI